VNRNQRGDGQTLGRSTRNFRRLKEELRLRARANRWPCFWCGGPIDYDLPHGSPDSFQADHIKSWSTHPELREDPANLGPVHARCNNVKGDGPSAPPLGRLSRNW
jgi:hypothetical protein